MSVRNVFLETTNVFKHIIPLDFLIRFSNQDVVLPFYHLITDQNPVHIKHLYTTRSTTTFEKDLEYLLKYYNVVDIEGLLNGQKTPYSRKPGFLLSFDDGLREIFDVVAPILVKKGIPAICFLNSSFTDNKNIFYRYKVSIILEHLLKKATNAQQALVRVVLNLESNINVGSKMLSLKYSDIDLIDKISGILEIDYVLYLKEIQPYMTSQQINSLIGQGFYFGAHSIDHPNFENLDLKEQIRQTVTSISWVRKNYFSKYDLFAFPFSDIGVTRDFFTRLKQEYSNCITFGTSGFKAKEFPLHFQRIAMEASVHDAETILKNEYLYDYFKKVVGMQKMKRNESNV